MEHHELKASTAGILKADFLLPVSVAPMATRTAMRHATRDLGPSLWRGYVQTAPKPLQCLLIVHGYRAPATLDLGVQEPEPT